MEKNRQKTSHEQVLNKAWTSFEQVIKSFEQFMNNYEQVMNK